MTCMALFVHIFTGEKISLMKREFLHCSVFSAVLCITPLAQARCIEKKDPQAVVVQEAMRSAANFMVNELSNRGGYLWYYSKDHSEVFGEIPARKSQVWVQGAGTPAMGELFLEIYRQTGEACYLDYARRAANVLVYGQRPSGGWHYFIDFNRIGLEEWYRDTASQFIVGWEEYRHYYGNCTFDDNVTQGATHFLLGLYMETLDPLYLGPLRKALEFVLESQYPNGGWPQRYPLRYEFAHDGLPDYTSFFTLNDGSMNNIIDLLLKAYTLLGNEEYLEAARRGGDFFMISQGPEGRAAWTDQFDMELRPATGRTHEPACIQARYTLSTIEELEKLYLFTGDRRYLRPIPAALDWLESVILEVDDRGRPVYPKACDPVSNLPIERKILPRVTEEGYAKYAYSIDSSAAYISYPGVIPGRKRYERVRDVEAEGRLELYREISGEGWGVFPEPEGKTISRIIREMDEDGGWPEHFTVHDIERTMEPNFDSLYEKGSYLYAVKELEGYSTRTFLRNMYLMLGYYKSNK